MQRLLRAFVLLATIAVMFAVATFAAFARTPILTASEASERAASGALVLLDIRTPEDWKGTGRADGWIARDLAVITVEEATGHFEAATETWE